MSTKFTHAAGLNATTDKIASLGSGTAYDLSSFTIGVLCKPATGFTRGYITSRSNATRTAGWYLEIAPSGVSYANWKGTTNEGCSFTGTTHTENAWNWMFWSWDGTTWSRLYSGLYNGALSTRTRSRDLVGTSLTSAVGQPWTLGSPDVDVSAYNLDVAFMGMWSGALSTATIDAYAADMSGSGGLAAAVEYFKWTSADSTGITGGKLGTTSSAYTSISLNAGPDPIVVQRYINTGSTTGGDGTTNATTGTNRAFVNWTDAKTAMLAEYPNLVTANVQIDVDVTGLIDSSSSSSNLSGFTSDSTHFLRIRAASGQEHAGYYDATKAGFTSLGGTTLTLPSYTRLENLQIVNSNTNLNSGFGIVEDTTILGSYVIGCVIHRYGRTAGTVTQGDAYNGGYTVKSVTLVNNVISGSWFNGIGSPYVQSGSQFIVYNNTIIGCTNSGMSLSGDHTATTTYIKNNRVEVLVGGTCYNKGSQTFTSSTNFSSDATSPDGAAYQNKTGTYTNAAKFIYTLRPTDAGIDQGTALTTDASGKYSFSTDIKGTTRSGSWEVGAFDAASYTVIQRYINNSSGNTSGGDGSTNALAGSTRAFINWRDAKTAMLAEYPDLVAANVQIDVDVTGLIYNVNTFNVSAPVELYGWTANDSRYIRVRAASGQAHAGYFDATKAGFTADSGVTISIDSYVRVENLQIVNNNTALNNGYAFVESSVTTKLGIIISGCVIHRYGRSAGTVTDGSAYEYYGGISQKTITFVNNVFSGTWFNGLTINYFNTGSAVVVYNNTFVGIIGTGILMAGGFPSSTAYIKNNRIEVISGGTCYNFSSNTPVTATNFSSDATSPDGSSYRSKTGTYTDAGNFIYTLQSTDAGIDQGTSLTTDASSKYSFSTDIKGTTRAGSWEIGAFDAASYLVVQRYINAASSGGDGTTNATSGTNAAYSSLLSAVTAIYAAYPNFTVKNVQMNVDVTGLPTTLGGTNWLSTYPITQDTTRYLQFQAAAGQRHTGQYSISKAGFKDQSEQGFVLYEVPSYTRFDGLQLVIPDTVDQGCAMYNTVDQQGIYITNCVLHRYGRSALATQGNCIEWSGIYPKGLVFVNNVISGSWYNGLVINYALGVASNVIIYNNTIKLDAVASGTNYGFKFGSGWTDNGLWLKNNRVEGPSVCYSLNGTQTTATNMSSDASSPQTALRSLTGTFTNAAAYDLSLATGDAGINQGTSLATDASGKYSFTTDITGAIRGTSWEIGAFDYTLVPTTTTTSTTAAPITSTTTVAPTTYPSAAVFDSPADSVSFTSGALYDVSTFTYAILFKPKTGFTNAQLVSRHSTSTLTGWEAGITSTSNMFSANWKGTSGQQDGFNSAFTVDAWNWLFFTWNGSVWSCRSGIYGGALTTRTRANGSVGSGLTSQVGQTLRLGQIGSYHDGTYPQDTAFFGVWNGVLSDATMDAYAANMTASGGLAAAIEYWKWAATDTTSITGGIASTPGTYSSITLNSGPDAAATTTTTTVAATTTTTTVAATTTTTTVAATTTTTTVSGSTTTTTLAPARIRAWMLF